MSSDAPQVLRAEKITLGYPGAEDVVKDVSLSLSAGKLYAVTGPNGAGKSTLLAALAGILLPRTGKVLFQEAPLTDLSRRERARRIGYLPQTVRPSISYTVQELVHLGRYAHGNGLTFETEEDRLAAAHALRATRTEHLADRLFRELSGGERQRVLVASVLAGEPEVILLDEPTASLDISGSVGVFETLRHLAESGRTVGVVTHDLNLAGRYADSMGLLASGAVIAEGPPEEVLQHTPLSCAYGGGFSLISQPGTAVNAVLPCAAKETEWPR